MQSKVEINPTKRFEMHKSGMLSVYPIRDEIPVMLVEEATTEK
jgi:uncharacterized protein YbaR (Trm112 family)